jgi:hypothetical protein
MRSRRQITNGPAATNAIQMAAHNQRKASGTCRRESSIYASQTEANPIWSGSKMKPWRRKVRQ